MSKLETKYFNNVYLISDTNRKKKLQELFLRSIKNDLSGWKKVIRFDKEKGTKDTDFYSKDYNGYVFQWDYDRSIGIVSNPGDVFELVFDYADYKDNKYPDEIANVIKTLIRNIFTSGIKFLNLKLRLLKIREMKEVIN